MKVIFQEDGHKYFSEIGEEFISVTTLIDKFKKPFDKEYWSLYKAIERFYTNTFGYEEWISFKRTIGYKNVNSHIKKYAKPEEKLQINSYQRDILIEWEDIKETACIQGKEYHESKELEWKREIYHKIGAEIVFLAPVELINYDYSKLPDGVYAELLVSLPEDRIAGMIDLTIIKRPYFDITDYKTVKKLAFQSYQNPKTLDYDMMKPPVAHIQDCNYMHYTLQLSHYARILEHYGLKRRKLAIRHVLRDDKGVITPSIYKDYNTNYLDREATMMIDYWKKGLVEGDMRSFASLAASDKDFGQ